MIEHQNAGHRCRDAEHRKKKIAVAASIEFTLEDLAQEKEQQKKDTQACHERENHSAFPELSFNGIAVNDDALGLAHFTYSCATSLEDR